MGSPKAIENWFWGESRHASRYCALRNPCPRCRRRMQRYKKYSIIKNILKKKHDLYIKKVLFVR